MNISIPMPCYENWENMISGDKGRYCQTCAKTVTDFTGMTTREISDFLIQNRSEKICGRFTNRQLAMDYDENIQTIAVRIAQTGWPLIKKMAVVFLFLFILYRPAQAQSVSNRLSDSTATLSTKMIPKTDSLIVADSVSPASLPQCIEGKLGKIIITSKKEKRSAKKVQQRHNKEQNATSQLTGEVVVVAGLVRTD